MDSSQLDYRIDQLESAVSSGRGGGAHWKQAWEQIKEITGHFKQVRYPSKADRENAWQRFQGIVDEVKRAQANDREQWEQKSRDSTRYKEEALERAERAHPKGAFESFIDDLLSFGSRSNELNQKKTELKEYSQKLRDAWDYFNKHKDKILGRDRQEVFTALRDVQERIDRLWEEWKKAQDQAHKEWEKRAAESSRHKEETISKAERARPPDNLVGLVDSFIIGPISTIVDALSGGLLGEIDNKKGELKACSEKLRDAWDYFNRHKEQMLGKDKQEAFAVLRSVQEELDGAWSAMKEWQDRAHQARQEAWEARQEAWRDKMDANIERLESRLRNLNDILSKREDHLSDLEDKRSSAWNDDFRDRVDDWIREEEDRIDNIKSQIHEVEGWLDDAKSKRYR